MNAVQWPPEARAAAFEATAYTQVGKGLVVLREAILEALLPHVQSMVDDARAEEESDFDVYCDQRHVSEEEVDTLQREAQDWHDAEHRGPWQFCSNDLCYAVREILG